MNDITSTKYTDFIPGEVDLENVLKYPMAWQEYRTYLEKCSDTVWKTLFGMTTYNYLLEFSVNSDLTALQTVEMSRTIRDVLIGKLYMGNMVNEVSSKLQLSEEKAREICNAIVENLFKPALEDIKKIQVENFADRIKGANTQTPDNVIDLREKR